MIVSGTCRWCEQPRRWAWQTLLVGGEERVIVDNKGACHVAGRDCEPKTQGEIRTDRLAATLAAKRRAFKR